jgi:hypothetical protein
VEEAFRRILECNRLRASRIPVKGVADQTADCIFAEPSQMVNVPSRSVVASGASQQQLCHVPRGVRQSMNGQPGQCAEA